MNLSGNIFDYGIAFASGVVVSFTPCVYPVMPLTASFIAGANTRGTKLMGFVISLIYVLGLAITYCTMAVIAAVSGKVFGQLQSNPILWIVVANVLIFFALVMLDVIPLPYMAITGKQKVRPKNLWSVLLFGMASGLIVGPCTAPVLGTLLGYAASKQNILHAVSLLFVFSYGVGASLILIGTFSGLLSSIPKSGPWLKRVKQFCGVILMIMAEFYLVKAGQLLF